MKQYCYIENGQISRIDALPTNWNNISNFYLLSDEELLSYGWLPVEEVLKENTDLEKGYHIQGNKVINVIESVPEEIVSAEIIEEQRKKQLWISVRQKRNKLLQDSDKYMLIDLFEKYPVEIQQQIKQYRQQLRDIPQQFNHPLSVIWPSKVWD